MEYRRLGKAGIKVSALSYGSWWTFNNQLDVAAAKKMMHKAFDAGINFFDTAEVYANGSAEIMMGEILRDFKREDLVISTKIFWGGDGPNDTGLSRKHLLEGTYNALQRLQLEYVDLLFAHRPDPDTSIEETVRAMDYLVRSGQCLYWGTSEWSAKQIGEAYTLSYQLGCVPPSMEQPEYNLFNRNKIESEYLPLFDEWGMGTTIWSPLNGGVLTGKYNEGIPEGSRLAERPQTQGRLTKERLDVCKKLAIIANDVGCTMAQLALAWCLRNPNVSTAIIGATKPDQLEDNLGALNVRLDDEIIKRIEVAGTGL